MNVTFKEDKDEDNTKFNEGWWNCFLSYTDTISFSIAAYDFAKEQMEAAGVKINEINKVLNEDFAMTDITRNILTEYKQYIEKR